MEYTAISVIVSQLFASSTYGVLSSFSVSLTVSHYTEAATYTMSVCNTHFVLIRAKQKVSYIELIIPKKRSKPIAIIKLYSVRPSPRNVCSTRKKENLQ